MAIKRLVKFLAGAVIWLNLLTFVSSSTDKVVVCYYGSWATYRSGNGKFTVEDIDTSLCTHYVYTFVGLYSSGTINLLDEYLVKDLDALNRFAALKNNNPDIKVILAMGGWNEGSVTYATVAANANLRAVLIQNTVSLLQEYGFDGFDLDWEYPALRGGTAKDKENLVTLLKEFREEFDLHGYSLSAAVAAPTSYIETSYNVTALNQYLDFIHLMTYDFHAYWDGVTGHNSPLYGTSDDDLLSVNAAVQSWLKNGASPEKLVVGIPLYGRTFTLSSADSTGVGEPVSGAGISGPYTLQSGFLGYNELAEVFQSGDNWVVERDSVCRVPYAYSALNWISFDDPESVGGKAEYVNNLGLGGVMVWSIETDDFLGLSGENFALLKSINAAFGRNLT